MQKNLVRVSKTTKYSEGYSRAAESNFVRFVRDFRSKNKQWHQPKALVRVSKTTKYSEGYLRTQESSFVRSVPDFTRQNTQEASAKSHGSRERDHEIHRGILTA
jgi:hypothetical protein